MKLLLEGEVCNSPASSLCSLSTCLGAMIIGRVPKYPVVSPVTMTSMIAQMRGKGRMGCVGEGDTHRISRGTSR